MNNPLVDPKDIKSEKEFRKDIITLAKKLGCDIEIKQIFDKFDVLLKNCKNLEERKQIAALGAIEIHKFFGCRGGLTINGVEVIPADPTAIPPESII